MKPFETPLVRYAVLVALLGGGLYYTKPYWSSPGTGLGSEQAKQSPNTNATSGTNVLQTAKTNLAMASLESAKSNAPLNAAATNLTNQVEKTVASTNSAGTNLIAAAASTNMPVVAGGPGMPNKPETESTLPPDQIQLSFQGANIEMIVQWLAKNTGKTVIKHPRVQCQLTIVSSKKQPHSGCHQPRLSSLGSRRLFGY